MTPTDADEEEEFGIQFDPGCRCGHELSEHDPDVHDKPCRRPLCRCLKFREEEH